MDLDKYRGMSLILMLMILMLTYAQMHIWSATKSADVPENYCYSADMWYD